MRHQDKGRVESPHLIDTVERHSPEQAPTKSCALPRALARARGDGLDARALCITARTRLQPRETFALELFAKPGKPGSEVV